MTTDLVLRISKIFLQLQKDAIDWRTWENSKTILPQQQKIIIIIETKSFLSFFQSKRGIRNSSKIISYILIFSSLLSLFFFYIKVVWVHWGQTSTLSAYTLQLSLWFCKGLRKRSQTDHTINFVILVCIFFSKLGWLCLVTYFLISYVFLITSVLGNLE